MERGDGQSPEKLLSQHEDRSDGHNIRREKASIMLSGFLNINQLEQQNLLQSTLNMSGFVTPVHQTPSPNPGGMISPLQPMPYATLNNSGMSGIMPLTNFNFGNTNNNTNNNGNTPPRKFTSYIRSPKVIPLHIVHHPDEIIPPPPGQQPNYPNRERGIHYFGEIVGPKIPWMVPTLVMVHSLIFAITMYENDCPHTSPKPKKCVLRFLNRLSFQPLNENPLLGPSYKALLSIGAAQSSRVTDAGQGWRLLTCIWLHAGLFHLLVNMFALLLIGLRLEKDFGWIRVVTIYIMAGFGGSLLSALFMLQNQISVGASGALMGLLGATTAEILINWSGYRHQTRLLAALLLTIALNLTFGLMPHVNNFAHIGGLLAGVLLGFIFLMRPQFAWINQQMVHSQHQVQDEMITTSTMRSSSPSVSRVKHTRMQIITWFLALGLLLISYAMAILALYKGYGLQARRMCKWCQYMSCVPSFLWECRSY